MNDIQVLMKIETYGDFLKVVSDNEAQPNIRMKFDELDEERKAYL